MVGRRKLMAVFLSGMICVMACCGAPALADTQRVRAKIGILVKSGERTSTARSREILKAGDSLRIYVHPEKALYLYLVHTDGKKVQLLNMTAQKLESSTLVLPSVQAFYKVDGVSPYERFTIICSPHELPELSAMVSKDFSPAKWQEVENELSKNSKIDLAVNDEAPFAIAGNVRGGLDNQNTDPVVSNLQIFSGNGVLVKQYEFQIKK